MFLRSSSSLFGGASAVTIALELVASEPALSVNRGPRQ
jgi:hypothetical protein